ARLVLSAVQPESKGKVKARTAFMPESGDIDIGILARFLTQQEKLICLMETSAQLPIDRIIITSTVSPLVTYRLVAAYRSLIAHEHRHLQQAERVMQEQTFPRY